MNTATALVPYHDFLPARASIEGPWVDLDHTPDRSRQEAAVRVITPHGADSLYGFDGREATVITTGEHVDLYV